VKQFGPKAESAFEAVATLLLNWCKGWFELFPNPPLPLLRRFLVSGAPGAGARTAINVTNGNSLPNDLCAARELGISAVAHTCMPVGIMFGCASVLMQNTSLLCKLRMYMQLWLSMIFCDICDACLWLCPGLRCAADAIQA
jgi:hypothetical protein